MRNWTILSVWDIPIRVNITLAVFLPALAWIISREDALEANARLLETIGPHSFEMAVLTDGMTPWLIGFGAAIGLFVGVTLHELGHSWMAMRYDIGITSITLWIFGGLARLEDIPEDWNIEFWIAIAGPVTSVLVGIVAWGVFVAVPDIGQPLLFIIGWLAVINVVLAVFNMLPAFPMDGGRILRALLSRNRPYVEATRTAATVGKGFAIAMGLLGILAFAPILVLVAMFVYIAATAESRATVLRDLLRGVVVEDLMRPAETAMSADTSVQEALEGIMRHRVTGFPVVDADGAYLGLVGMQDIQAVEAGTRSQVTLREIVHRDVPTVGPTDDAFDVLQRFAVHRTDRIPVVVDGRLEGVITHQDLLDAIEIFQGLKADRPELLPGDGYP